jgi:hypothetical protein
VTTYDDYSETQGVQCIVSCESYVCLSYSCRTAGVIFGGTKRPGQNTKCPYIRIRVIYLVKHEHAVKGPMRRL